jgi:CubicO group peptidase (beta-lactamase class C family)
MVRALDLTTQWPVPTVAAAVVRDGDVADRIGPTTHAFSLASIGKPLVAWTCLVAVEEGTIDLDDNLGPHDGHQRTVRHLLSHAGGYGFNTDDRIIEPEKRRIYGNAGIDVVADHLSRSAGMPFDEYLRLGVLEPLGMGATEVRGLPSHQMWSTVDDLARFLLEVIEPTLVSDATAAEAIRPHYPTLGGIVPGVGRFETCPWGLGFEVRGDKTPHWTGSRNSSATFGHFGGAGTMMWVDPGHGDLGVVALADRAFDQWALDMWPELSDSVIEEFAGGI